MQEQITHAPNWIDRTGMRFGRLTVLYFIGRGGPKKGYYMWMCRCECGKEKAVSTNSLKQGTQSCGCFHLEQIKNPRRPYSRLSDTEACLNYYIGVYVHSAKNRGYEFSLSKPDVEELAFGNCFYCGCRPVLQGWRTLRAKRVKTEIFLNGIDRVDSSEGYVKGNVVSCCTRCNRAKQEMSVEDFLAWIERVHERAYAVLSLIQSVRNMERNCR